LQEFEDIEEKIEELIPQLGRFKQNMATITDNEDPEETDRRREVARCAHWAVMAMAAPNGRCSVFEQIEETFQGLLAKSALARVADKGEDSKLVARLIERLREAIVCYQVGHYHFSALIAVDRGSRCHNSKRSTVKSPISQ
jgi:hypothetical protein